MLEPLRSPLLISGVAPAIVAQYAKRLEVFVSSDGERMGTISQTYKDSVSGKVEWLLLDTGIVPMVEPETTFATEAPGGIVEITAECRGGKAQRITVRNVASFADKLDAKLEVLTVAPLLGEAIHRIHHDQSISALFRHAGGAKR